MLAKMHASYTKHTCMSIQEYMYMFKNIGTKHPFMCIRVYVCIKNIRVFVHKTYVHMYLQNIIFFSRRLTRMEKFYLFRCSNPAFSLVLLSRESDQLREFQCHRPRFFVTQFGKLQTSSLFVHRRMGFFLNRKNSFESGNESSEKFKLQVLSRIVDYDYS